MGKSVGIDFGTSYLCVSVFQENSGLVTVPNEYGKNLTSSCVAFTENEILVGEAAKNTHDHYDKIYGIKQLIDADNVFVQDSYRKYSTLNMKYVNNKLMIIVNYKGNERLYSTEDIVSIIFSKLKIMAENFLGEEVTDAVISIPFAFSNHHRQILTKAAIESGLNVLRLMQGSTAVLMKCYIGKSRKEEENVIALDLGSGYINVSIASLQNGIIEILAVNGDSSLGTEMFAKRLADYLAQEFANTYKIDITGDNLYMQKLLAASKAVMRILSSQECVSVNIPSFYERIDFSVDISRNSFQNLNKDLFQKCISNITDTINGCRYIHNTIYKVLLIGGSSNIPGIKSLIDNYFGKKDIYERFVYPDAAVANGTAIQAAILTGVKNELLYDILLLEVIPHSLKIQLHDGIMETMIKNNTTIPTKESQCFTTVFDNQSDIILQVYEGESYSSINKNLLGRYRLSNVIPAPKGIPKLDVYFDVCAKMILKVTATDRNNGQEFTATMVDNNISDTELERMAVKLYELI